jgi:pimeloyl-[acyl-carrier protein] methyl ester esterase
LNRIFTKTSGQGRPLLAIHGWGMNHYVWEPVMPLLEKEHCITRLDLPGHGMSRGLSLGSVDEIAHEIASELHEPTVIMGWSLGGLIAQKIGQLHPGKVKALILVATTPCFACQHDWENAMQQSVLQGFSSNLEQDFAGTLKRFLALQFLGVKGVQGNIKKLRENMLQTPPDIEALRQGLTLLHTTDLRHEPVQSPQLWLFGSKDRLVPIAAKNDIHTLIQKIPNAQTVAIEAAGHAPFISHPEEFVKQINHFLAKGENSHG